MELFGRIGQEKVFHAFACLVDRAGINEHHRRPNGANGSHKKINYAKNLRKRNPHSLRPQIQAPSYLLQLVGLKRSTTMAISRQTLVLAGLVVVLTVVCIALVITLDSFRGDYLAREEEVIAELEPEVPKEEVEDRMRLEHPWEKNPRLSREVLPLHYDLYLHPDLDSGTFMGESERDLS